jgi:hypothetical protein
MIPRRFGQAMLLAGLLALGACDSLLDVDTPSRIPADELENPAYAPLLVNGAVGDFECAFGAYVVLGGLIGEELVDATQTADRYPYDRRDINPADRRYATLDCVGLGVYTPLNTARASADNTLARLEEWTDAEVPRRTELMARAATYAGYSLTLLGEGFCSATISSLDDAGRLIHGTELQPAQVLAEAEARFGRALAAAEALPAGAVRDSLLAFARVGRARARLDLGRYAEARADAALVPAGFVKNVSAAGSTARRENRVWAQNGASSEATSVGPRYRGLGDPRVPATDRNKTSVTGVALWRQDKYGAAATPIPLATYEEARLIMAEADARANALDSAIEILDESRARGGQEPFAGSTQAEVMAEVIDQRRRELFLESHHLGDAIRFGISLQPAAGTTYHGGGTYGSSTCLPLPDVERLNNPNL